MSTNGLITSRDEFFRTLDTTTAEIDGLAAREPAYPVWKGLQRQLQAMKQWSANGDPTPDQRGKISIGLIAARELEPPATPAMGDLIDRLHMLSYAWRHWPPAEA
jgi:hypothetical protein